jgi:hypothetical protein
MVIKALRIGLDIGKRVDPSAICISTAELKNDKTYYNIHRIERLPMVKYVEQAEILAEILTKSWAQYQTEMKGEARSPLPYFSIDVTGVGDGVTEIILANPTIKALIKAAHFLVFPVRFVHGDRITYKTKREINLGKEALASRLQALSEMGQIKIPMTIKAKNPFLLQEFYDFDVDVNEAGRTTYGANRSGSHDDMIIALGLASLMDLRLPRHFKVPPIAAFNSNDLDNPGGAAGDLMRSPWGQSLNGGTDPVSQCRLDEEEARRAKEWM